MRKNLYLTFGLLLMAAPAAMAQNAAIDACVDGDTIQIAFDYSLNCELLGTGLEGNSAIGFHSGANQWSNVVDWDAAGAKSAVNDGNDVFTVRFHYTEYHAAADTPDNYYFVFNQGATEPGDPWAVEGKDADNDSDGNCDDFFIVYGDLEVCAAAASISEADRRLANAIALAPNPVTGESVMMTLDIPSSQAYDVTVVNITGQVVLEERNTRGNQFVINRGNMKAGYYFVTVRTDEGARATKHLVIQ